MAQSDDIASLVSQFVEYFDEIKVSGEIFAELATNEGIVELLAEIEIIDNGNTLHIKDIAIYPKESQNLKGLISEEIFKLKAEFIKAAYHLGFGGLRITGKRHEDSTSANPGHVVDIFTDLKMRFKGGESDASDKTKYCE